MAKFCLSIDMIHLNLRLINFNQDIFIKCNSTISEISVILNWRSSPRRSTRRRVCCCKLDRYPRALVRHYEWIVKWVIFRGRGCIRTWIIVHLSELLRNPLAINSKLMWNVKVPIPWRRLRTWTCERVACVHLCRSAHVYDMSLRKWELVRRRKQLGTAHAIIGQGIVRDPSIEPRQHSSQINRDVFSIKYSSAQLYFHDFPSAFSSNLQSCSSHSAAFIFNFHFRFD